MLISTIVLKNKSILKVNKKEAMRYLGIKGEDSETLGLLEEIEKELFSFSEPRAVYIKTDIAVKDDIVDFGFMKVNSKKLAQNLDACTEAYLFCATLGITLDRQYERLCKISQAKATVFSAAASSLIESFCDYVNRELVNGVFSKPRFSCGYGDFCIEHQSEILNVLEANKRLGVCLTDSFMMVPVKTVTAVIGIRR